MWCNVFATASAVREYKCHSLFSYECKTCKLRKKISKGKVEIVWRIVEKKLVTVLFYDNNLLFSSFSL